MKPDAGALAPRVSSGRLRNRRPSTCTAVLWTVSGIVASLSVQVCEVREIPVSLLVVESVAYEKVVRNTEALIPHRDIHQTAVGPVQQLSLIHISEPTRRTPISYAVFCLKKKTKHKN